MRVIGSLPVALVLALILPVNGLASGSADTPSDDRPDLPYLHGTGPPIHFLSFIDLDTLSRAGLADPVTDIVSDLQRRPDLIPYNHGYDIRSDFGFHWPELIHVLTSRWVYAYCENGHRSAHLLLEFEVVAPDSIHWTVLEASLD